MYDYVRAPVFSAGLSPSIGLALLLIIGLALRSVWRMFQRIDLLCKYQKECYVTSLHVPSIGIYRCSIYEYFRISTCHDWLFFLFLFRFPFLFLLPSFPARHIYLH